MSFPCARHTIGKNCWVAAIKDILHMLRHAPVENIFLSRFTAENVVEYEASGYILFGVLAGLQ